MWSAATLTGLRYVTYVISSSVKTYKQIRSISLWSLISGLVGPTSYSLIRNMFTVHKLNADMIRMTLYNLMKEYRNKTVPRCLDYMY